MIKQKKLTHKPCCAQVSLSEVTMQRYILFRSIPAGHSALSPPPYDFGGLLTLYTQVSDCW